MITARSRSPFGGKATVIHTDGFNCVVRTAKAGWFQKPSTLILELRGPYGSSDQTAVGKVLYPPSLTRADRLRVHDIIAISLEELGAEGESLEIAIEQVCSALKAQGTIAGAVNVA
jgi:hypothetical protein